MWVTTACVGPVTSTRHAEDNSQVRPRRMGIVPSNPLEHLKNESLEELQHIRGILSSRDLTMVQNSVSMVKKIGRLNTTPLSSTSQENIALLVREKELEATLASINRLEARKRHIKIRTESRVVPSEMSSGPVEQSKFSTYENFGDVMGNESTSIGGPSPTPSTAGQMNNLDLTNFLARPVPLDTFDIVIGDALDFSIDVWDSWASQPSVRAKLRNYAFLKGNLHVKIAISGSPFHYGKILVSYQPYAIRNTILQANLTNYGALPGYRPLLLNYLSQSPESAVMDVKDNTPLDIECPFISPNPMHRLFNASTLVISDVTSFSDLENAGTLYMYGISPCGSVSTTASDLTVYIYAWMTEVELGAPTGTQIAITTESRVMDERETGPVETALTTAADAANALTTVPTIAPVAKASSMILRGLSGMASLLGWSVPPVMNEAVFVKNQPYMNGAQTIGVFTGKRLTLDPKQEVTVDPRDGSVEEDELQITAISRVGTYLRTFTWATTDAPLTGNIFICPVTPNLNTVVNKLTNYWVQPTAMSFANMPFRFWRGTIHFKFEVVVSQFHRGKLAFYYEPNCYQYALIDANLDTNKQFIKVIDIQETQIVEFSIGWAFHRDWCMNEIDTDTFPYVVTVDDFGELANGYIAVVPFTSVQSPDDSDVTVNVYVSCPDLQVNTLNSEIYPSSRITTESRVVEHDVAHSSMPLNDSTATTQGISERHFGEQPLSFRSVLKRYVTFHTLTVTQIDNSHATYSFAMPSIPAIQPQVGSSSISYFFLLSYLRYAYLGLKGGIRYRVTLHGRTPASWDDTVRATLMYPVSGTITPAGSSSATVSVGTSTVNGTALFHRHTNFGVEFEVPYYSSNRFLFSFANNLIGTNNTGEMCEVWSKWWSLYWTSYTARTDINAVAKFDMATAEDFTMFRFQGAPYYVT